jgi:hypothetical protein
MPFIVVAEVMLFSPLTLTITIREGKKKRIFIHKKC